MYGYPTLLLEQLGFARRPFGGGEDEPIIEPDYVATACKPRANRAVFIAESVADRAPRARKRGSVVGFLVDPFRRRKVVFESGLERDLLRCLIASPHVADVREQQTVGFITNGRKRRHTFDVIIDWKSGSRQASPIKYVEDVDADLVNDVTAICEQRGDDVADTYVLLTEYDTSPTAVRNARRVIDCGLDFDLEAQDAIRHYLSKAGEFVTLPQCDAQVGEGKRGSRAAIALIQSGLVVTQSGVPIRRDTVLRNCFTK